MFIYLKVCIYFSKYHNGCTLNLKKKLHKKTYTWKHFIKNIVFYFGFWIHDLKGIYGIRFHSPAIDCCIDNKLWTDKLTIDWMWDNWSGLDLKRYYRFLTTRYTQNKKKIYHVFIRCISGQKAFSTYCFILPRKGVVELETMITGRPWFRIQIEKWSK